MKEGERGCEKTNRETYKWGKSTTLSKSLNPPRLPPYAGSFSNTSNPAPPIFLSFNASSNARSSMIPPLAVLITTAVDFIHPNSSRPIIYLVFALRGQWRERTSHSSSKDRRLGMRVWEIGTEYRVSSTVHLVSGEEGEWTSTSHPNARSSFASSYAISPIPTNPTFFPPRPGASASILGTSSPPLIRLSTSTTRRKTVSMRVMASSATAKALPPGTLVTAIPRERQVGRGTLSTPVPLREMIRRLGAARTISSVTSPVRSTKPISSTSIRDTDTLKTYRYHQSAS